MNTSQFLNLRENTMLSTAQITLTCWCGGLQLFALLLSKNLLEVPGLLN